MFDGGEDFGAGGEDGVVVVAADFEEGFGGEGGGEVFLGVGEGDDGVLTAVHDEDRDFETGEFVEGVVFDGADETDGEPGEHLRAEVGDAGEGALEDDAAELLAHGEFDEDAAAKGFAVADNVGGGEAFLAEPLVCGLGVAACVFLAGMPRTSSVAAIIEDHDARAGFEQEAAEFEAVADVAGVAVANEDHPAG